jgi:hypothetical protein
MPWMATRVGKLFEQKEWRNINMNTAMRDYIFFDTPLKTQKGKIALAVFLIAIAIPAILGLGTEEPRILVRSFLWMPYSILGSVLTYLIVSFFDRKRAFRTIQFSVIAFVTFFSAFAALYFNNISPARTVTVGFVEEFFKISPVIILAIFFPAIIRTKRMEWSMEPWLASVSM